MSRAFQSDFKDKKASKEPHKASGKPLGHSNAGGGIMASGYNPILGTFLTLQTSSVSSAPPLHGNGRFQNIDETENHSGKSFGNGVEYDSVSNNGSLSGESEEHKEKTSPPPLRLEAVPGADNGKREKIRQKNERKHQRQKEKRAQELHERCSGYLMSRKLEALAQQLVAMGFSSERATMALILNEGRVEESVAWLFEGVEETDKQREHNLDARNNLKIDITKELARIADMEIMYKCSKQEVERAIVACEGDLEKAEETLRVQKQEPPFTPFKPEETGDPTASHGKLPLAMSQNLIRAQTKRASSNTGQLKEDEKDFNYTKIVDTVGSSVDSGSKKMQSLKRIQPKLEWEKPQQSAGQPEKWWPSSRSNPSVSYSLASPLHVSPSPAMTETRYVAVGNELKNLQLGSVKEPVIVMQRPQSINPRQMPATCVSISPSGTAAGWYPPVETMKANGLMPQISSSRKLTPNNANTNQLFSQLHYLHQQQIVSSTGSLESLGTSRGSNMLNRRTGASSTLAAASSLGLFSGSGSNGSSWSSSPVDWNTSGSMTQSDYTNIDWSVDGGPSMPRPTGNLRGTSSFTQTTESRTYASYNSAQNIGASTRPVLSNKNGVSVRGLPDGIASNEAAVGSSREWTSPFEEEDLFSLPRQFVYSPPL
ncbi:unnamed protein product [Ilex paraguariensis]|uniref:UBA domain-containing protein n=1 Tax=Ilex paraguariensis TaxID=185542 RepID=A0ABC8TLF2_9AQUA